MLAAEPALDTISIQLKYEPLEIHIVECLETQRTAWRRP